MVKFVEVDTEGRPTAFYSPDVHGSTKRDSTVEITDAQWQELIAHPGRRRITRNGGAVVVQAANSPVRPVASVAAAKRSAIHQEAARRTPTALKAYPQHERDSFLRQVKEAGRYRAAADPADAVTPMLDALASARGLTREEMVSRVEAKDEDFAVAFGPVLGAQQALEDQLEAVLADLDAGTITADQARQQIAGIDETDDANWQAAS